MKKSVITKRNSGAVAAILEADLLLGGHIRTTLQTGKMRKKNLISGKFYELLTAEAEKRNLAQDRLWAGFLPASTAKRKLFNAFGLPSNGFDVEIYRFQLERNDGDSTMLSEPLNPEDKKLQARDKRDNAQSSLCKLCHWIEAEAAWNAFVAYRTHKATMDKDPLRAFAMTAACYSVSLPNSTEKEKQQRWWHELDFLSVSFKRDFIESAPQVDGTLTKAKGAPANPVTQFEGLLFILWPLVLHGQWVIDDLVNFLSKEGVPCDDSFSRDPKNFLAYHGLRVATSSSSRKRETLALLPGVRPARDLVAAWKIKAQKVKSHRNTG
jgi:hypothetical protein